MTTKIMKDGVPLENTASGGGSRLTRLKTLVTDARALMKVSATCGRMMKSFHHCTDIFRSTQAILNILRNADSVSGERDE